MDRGRERLCGDVPARLCARRGREHANSIFVDEQRKPFPDDEQWAYLASVPRIDPATVELVAREATLQGSVVGVRLAETVDEEDATPWTRQPSGRRRLLIIAERLPDKVRGVLAQKLFVEKLGLPSQVLNQIKRLAAFHNPELY